MIPAPISGASGRPCGARTTAIVLSTSSAASGSGRSPRERSCRCALAARASAATPSGAAPAASARRGSRAGRNPFPRTLPGHRRALLARGQQTLAEARALAGRAEVAAGMATRARGRVPRSLATVADVRAADVALAGAPPVPRASTDPPRPGTCRYSPARPDRSSRGRRPGSCAWPPVTTVPAVHPGACPAQVGRRPDRARKRYHWRSAGRRYGAPDGLELRHLAGGPRALAVPAASSPTTLTSPATPGTGSRAPWREGFLTETLDRCTWNRSWATSPTPTPAGRARAGCPPSYALTPTAITPSQARSASPRAHRSPRGQVDAFRWRSRLHRYQTAAILRRIAASHRLPGTTRNYAARIRCGKQVMWIGWISYWE